MKIFAIVIAAIVASVFILSFIVDTSALGLRTLNLAVNLTDDYRITRNISYASSPWQKLNVYRSQVQQQNQPIIVFFYGGGWNWGDKAYFDFVASAFVKRGYVVVIPDYIKYPNGKFPQFIEDGAKAVAWVKHNISKFGGDTQRLFVAGHSAGAHTAALLATDRQYLRAAGIDSDVIKAVAGIAGPYNFTPKKPQYIKTFGEQNFDAMKVKNHVTGNEPAMILLHGSNDKTVGLFNIETMTEALTQAGVPVQKVIYDKSVSHVTILLKLHPWFAGQVNVAEDIDRFFRNR